ncbi:zinc finger CCCH domain-containing protein 14 isoform X2 [Lycium barbarum]|uniref:zinc finger CCCH domain-containing protein 14 isoform X2 n=1 Tax=Lycium barbarum TaxID=112863 RepID=UPI00293F78E2|nr:zinc finger CCCH domain-containing protein 14 isoform X2 [Lycium barbarum]
MQNENPSSDGLNTSTIDVNKNYTSSDATSPHLADNPFLSPTSTHQFDSSEFIPNFYSTFSRSSNSPSLTSFDDTDDLVIDHHRLHQPSYVLEYQQLYNRYTLCLAHLQESIKEVEALHQENESLRLVNTDLDRRLSLLTQATIQNCLLSDFNRFGLGVNHDNQIPDSRPPNIRQGNGNVVEPNRPERRNVEQRVSLPKSISVRSSGYLKLKAQGGGNNGGPSQGKTKQKSTNPPLTESQRVYVPGGKKEEEAVEFDVYNQGMFKTELCNKWQETGTCPYGENCQFAHGITELRPVIRHPRYKTEVCRMVLAGDMCPYGHRCHFRHSLTEEERRTGPALF